MTTRLLAEVPEAAAMLGVGRTKLYQLATEGEIQFVHIGRKTLVVVASLEAYVERLRANEPVPAA